MFSISYALVCMLLIFAGIRHSKVRSSMKVARILGWKICLELCME